MSMIIKGMEMPENCLECRFTYDESFCYTGKGLACYCIASEEVKLATNPSRCPLVPLPAGHGRIVDAAEVIEKANNSAWFDGDVSELALLLGSEVTTIIEAEGGARND